MGVEVDDERRTDSTAVEQIAQGESDVRVDAEASATVATSVVETAADVNRNAVLQSELRRQGGTACLEPKASSAEGTFRRA